MIAHLWDRLADAKARLDPVQSKYRVLFENPAEPEAPAAVLVPDPNFMAAALAGGALSTVLLITGAAISVLSWSILFVRLLLFAISPNSL